MMSPAASLRVSSFLWELQYFLVISATLLPAWCSTSCALTARCTWKLLLDKNWQLLSFWKVSGSRAFSFLAFWTPIHHSAGAKGGGSGVTVRYKRQHSTACVLVGDVLRGSWSAGAKGLIAAGKGSGAVFWEAGTGCTHVACHEMSCHGICVLILW